MRLLRLLRTILRLMSNLAKTVLADQSVLYNADIPYNSDIPYAAGGMSGLSKNSVSGSATSKNLAAHNPQDKNSVSGSNLSKS